MSEAHFNGAEKPLDLRDQVPDLTLLPGERVIAVQNLATPPRIQRPSSLRELHNLAQAESRGSIGDRGPVLASLALNDTQMNPDFHKYEAVYGRDSLRVALDLLDRYPKLAHATLRTLAQLQGVTHNKLSEEESGRIIHEARDPKLDAVARELTATRGWEWPYYGSVDATLEYIRTFAEYCRQAKHGISILNETYTGRDKREHAMADSFEAAVSWATGRLDANPEGLLEYQASSPGGLENQAWKDSWDSYFHADGTIANHHKGIASIEVQRVAYDALLDAADMYQQHLDKPTEAAALKERANRLKQQIMDRFWTEADGGYFILGTDRDESGKLRPLAIKTSNMGHTLHSRLLDANEPETMRRREAVIRQLFSTAMLGASGIRTLSKDEVRFRPDSYHNGSVWLWDTHFIARGLKRHGYYRLARELNRRVLSVINVSKEFPEFASGDDAATPHLNTRIIDLWDERNQCMNRIEQPPQEIQAWTVAAVILIKEEALAAPRSAADERAQAFEQEVLDSIKTT